MKKKFIWIEKINKYQIVNVSRLAVGVKTRFMGSNADTDKVYLGGEQFSKEYTWNIKEESIIPPK